MTAPSADAEVTAPTEDDADATPWKTTECTICNHPDAAAIDAGLLGGTPLRTVAGTYSLSRSAVHRHRQNHLSVQTITDPEDREQRAPLKLVDVHAQLSGLIDRLEQVAESAARSRKPAVVVTAMREQRQALEAVARLQADENLQRAASLESVQQWVMEQGVDVFVDILDSVLGAFGTQVRSSDSAGNSEQQRIAAALMAECMRRLDDHDPQTGKPHFRDLDTSAARAFVERQALEQTRRMDAEVERRVAAELRRRENQARPAIEAASSLRAIEGGAQ